MLCGRLDSTPAEVFKTSSRFLKFKVYVAVKCAEWFGHWKQPMKNSATALEEMTLKDGYYWLYKCRNPIIKESRAKPVCKSLVTTNIAFLPLGFQKTSSLTMGIAGDILRAEDREYEKDSLYENVADLIFGKDVSFANFESPVTEQELQAEVISDKGPPIECCSKQQFDVLASYKDKYFTVLNIANNHIFDMGTEGLETTLKTCSEKRITPLGVNDKPESRGLSKVVVCNDIKLGFVSATFGINGRQLPPGEDYRINVSRLVSKHVKPELDLLKQQIDDCKKQGCDLIAASVHWGYEFEFFPRKQQVEAAHELAEYGADLIIGHHPHVVQPVEHYRTQRDPNRVAIIAYSMGSMVWGYSAPHIALSIILNLTVSKGSWRGENTTYIEDVSLTPIFPGVSANNTKCIEKLSDHIGDNNSFYPRAYLDKLNKYANLVLAMQR